MCPDQPRPTSTPDIQSDVGIGLVELRRKDELINFWEFVQCSPIEFSLPESWLETGTSPEELSIMAVDIDGNICKCAFVAYEEFMKGVECSEVKTERKVLETEDSALK